MLDGRGLVDQIGAMSRQLGLMRSRLLGLKSAEPQDGDRLNDTKQRLVQACTHLVEQANSLAGPLKDRLSAENQWSDWVDINRQFSALAADCLALEESVHLRTDKRVASLCAVADKLAEALSDAVGDRRRHYVLVSEAERFGMDASAIHVGYGRLDVWNLNRVVHEFAHLWAREQADGPDGAQTAFVRSIKSWKERQAKEFFADIVAIFLMGPAYAFSCLVLDFYPADNLSSESHPSGDERAHCILMALEQLAPKYHEYSSGPVNCLHSQLCRFWCATRKAAGVERPIKNLIELEYATSMAIDRLAKQMPGSQYQSLEAANAVRNALERHDDRRIAQAAGVDILNGAWLARLEVPQDEGIIGMMTLKMLLEWK